MPDFRVTLSIGALAPGADPEALLPAAAAAAAELTMVESSGLTVVRGEPRATVRFEAEDDELAEQIAAHVVGAVVGLAAITDVELTRRAGARWRLVGRPATEG